MSVRSRWSMSVRSLLLVALALILGVSAAVLVNSFMQCAHDSKSAVVPVVVSVPVPSWSWSPSSTCRAGRASPRKR